MGKESEADRIYAGKEMFLGECGGKEGLQVAVGSEIIGDIVEEEGISCLFIERGCEWGWYGLDGF